MKRVTDISGIFFKVKDIPPLRTCSKRHLGIDAQDSEGAASNWTEADVG